MAAKKPNPFAKSSSKKSPPDKPGDKKLPFFLMKKSTKKAKK